MSRSGRRSLVAGGALVLAATGVGLVLIREGPGRDDAARSADDGRRLPAGQHLGYVGDSLLVALPARAYLSYARVHGDGFEAPERSDEAVLRVPIVARRPEAWLGIQVLGTDEAGQVTSVTLIGRYRDGDGRLTNPVWLADNDGVEMAWRTRPGWTWTVERQGTVLTTTARGHFRDDRAVTSRSVPRYSIEHEEPVKVDDDTTAQKSTEYVFSPRVPDRSVLGRTVSTIAPGGGVSATVAPDREVACETVSRVGGAPVRQSVASHDRVDLTNELFDQVRGLRTIGLSVCGDRFVVVIGVKDDTVKVPERGPRGTPVMAYVQPRISAD